MATKRIRDVKTGTKNREWVRDLLNEKGEGMFKCEFSGEGLSLSCSLIDDLNKPVLLEIRLGKDDSDLKNGYFKGSRDLQENLAMIRQRIFVLIACGQYSIVPGSIIDKGRMYQAETKGNETRTVIDMEGYLPWLSIHGGGFLENRNIAEYLRDVIRKIK